MKFRIPAFLIGVLIAVSSAYAAKVTDETALGGAPATNDLLRMVDVSDTTQSAQGSTKSMTIANLFTSPTFVTPALGTPASGVATNLTGTAAGLTAGAATALAANGTNCSAGSAPLGVDASGNAESCTAYAPTASPTFTGVVTVPSGSAAAPAIQLNGATQGIYSAAGNSVDISVAGVRTVAINNGAMAIIRDNYPLLFGASFDTGICRPSAGLIEIDNGSCGTYRDLKVRQHYVDQTITAGGTTGNQTINKAAGTVNLAAAGTTLTVTDSLVTTSSTVYCSVRTADTTALFARCVPASGSFVITINAAATAETSIGFFVVN